MKRLKVITLIAMALLLTAGCSIAGIFNSEPAEIEKDLFKLQSYIPGIEAGLTLLDKEDNNTITPKTANPTYISEILNKTPQTVYTEYNGTTAAVRIPGSGYFSDPYGNGLVQAYMTLEPVAATPVVLYKVTFYTTPKGNFEIDHNKEVYYVSSSDSSWSIKLSNGQDAEGKISEWTTYYLDNSIESRTVAWTSLSDSKKYDTITVPALTDAAYVYENLQAPTASAVSTAKYSSKSTFEFNPGKSKWYKILGTEYYTEDNSSGEEIRSSLTLASKGHKNQSSDTYLTKMVTRYQENIAQGTKMVRSLSYTSWNTSVSNAWVVYTTDANITKDAGKIKYKNAETTTWTASVTLTNGGINLSYSQKYTYDLTETEANSSNYTGTLEKDWGWGNVGVYTVTIEDGKYKEKWASNKSTALGTDMIIDLKNLDQLTIAVPGGNGSFTGAYEQGTFSGTYTFNGTAYEVAITKDIVWIKNSAGEWKYFNKDKWLSMPTQ